METAVLHLHRGQEKTGTKFKLQQAGVTGAEKTEMKTISKGKHC